MQAIQQELHFKKPIKSGIDLEAYKRFETPNFFEVHTLDGPYRTLSANFAYSLVLPCHLKHIPQREPELDAALRTMIQGNTLIELGCFKKPAEGLWNYQPREVHLVDPNINWKATTPLPFPLETHAEDALTFLRRGIVGSTCSIGMMGDNIISEKYAQELARHIFRCTPPKGYAFHTIESPFIVSAFEKAGFNIVETYGPGLEVDRERKDWTYYLFQKS